MGCGCKKKNAGIPNNPVTVKVSENKSNDELVEKIMKNLKEKK